MLSGSWKSTQVQEIVVLVESIGDVVAHVVCRVGEHYHRGPCRSALVLPCGSETLVCVCEGHIPPGIVLVSLPRNNR